MTTSDKVKIVTGIVVAAALFGVCCVVSSNEALPSWARIATDVLSALNLLCALDPLQEWLKKRKK